MLKILFICHGNICRSPMAEFVMKKLVSDANLADHFQIASAATSTEVSDRIGGSQPGGAGKPGLSAGEGGACQTRHFLRGEAGQAGNEGGLCGI